MSSKGKYIGISNRIPIVVLEFAINDYINTGKVNSQEYLKYILEFTRGENRAKKTLGHLVTIIKKNSKLIELMSHKINSDFNNLTSNDRKAFLLCLYALTFPISYDILNAFSVGFKVQEFISKRVIKEKMGAAYGSNRSMHIGVDETLPFILSCGIIERSKIGIFKKGEKMTIVNKLVNEIIVYTEVKLSGSKSILIDDIEQKPWFAYFNLSENIIKNPSHLLHKKDSSIGRGYLTI
jgi:hypothetical protein